MKVKLIAYTPNAERIIACAASGCYSEKPSSELVETYPEEKIPSFLGRIHGSTYEHANFTFSIEGISHPCSHQLVRHRHASYSQQSQRYVDIEETLDNFIIPPTVREVMDMEDALGDSRKDDRVYNAIENCRDSLRNLYKELDKYNIPSEDKRYFAFYGVASNLTVTMNARELIETFFPLRCCNRAQWEIREVANEMLRQCKEVCPNLFKHAGPSCVHEGKCPEHKPCGKAIKVTE